MCVVFFFQAEDGIRDLVRSRGLGDVYKRQEHPRQRAGPFLVRTLLRQQTGDRQLRVLPRQLEPVSYTHLTLPTSDLV